MKKREKLRRWIQAVFIPAGLIGIVFRVYSMREGECSIGWAIEASIRMTAFYYLGLFIAGHLTDDEKYEEEK